MPTHHTHMITITWLAWYVAFTLLLMALAWYPCCGEEEGTTYYGCQQCLGDVADGNAKCFAATISGMANNGCSDCAEYDGTYLLTEFSGGSTDYCYWRWNSTDTGPCGESGPNQVYVELSDQGSSTYRWNGSLIQYFGPTVLDQHVYLWRNVFGSMTKFDCLNATNYDIPYASQSTFNATYRCDASSATFKITTIDCA